MWPEAALFGHVRQRNSLQRGNVLSRGRVAQLLEVQRLPDSQLTRRTRSSLGENPAEPPPLFRPI